MLAILLNVPQAIADIGPDVTLDEGPPVRVEGKFLKRLAFRSGRGIDLSPVVVGRTVITAPQPNLAAPTTSNQPDSSSLFLLTTLAIAIGIGVATFVMWQSSQAAKQAREVRAQGRKEPDELFNHLDGESPNRPNQSDQSPSNDQSPSSETPGDSE